MKRCDREYARRQHGMATLLVALVLMMVVTVITLSVARTQATEQKIANNVNWHLRLSLQAEAALARAINHLNSNFDTTGLSAGHAAYILALHRFSAIAASGLHTELRCSGALESGEVVSIQTAATRDDHSGLQAKSSELVRPLAVLTPLAEFAPPLVVNGCLVATPPGSHVRPLDADSDRAGAAAWIKQGADCPPLPGIDTHEGRVIEKPYDDDLWPTVFSVDRETYGSLVAAQGTDAGHEPIYRSAHGPPGARWTESLGSPTRHVILHFPAASGCPSFAPGVRIYGIVFVDAACSTPLTGSGLEIYGSLMVNGNLNAPDARLELNHIQVADRQQPRLNYPVLRTVPVPGTWTESQ